MNALNKGLSTLVFTSHDIPLEKNKSLDLVRPENHREVVAAYSVEPGPQLLRRPLARISVRVVGARAEERRIAPDGPRAYTHDDAGEGWKCELVYSGGGGGGLES